MMNVPDSQRGLSSREIQALQREFGPNVLRKATKTQWPRILGQQFSSPLIWILLIAIFITGIFLGNWVDASVIAIAVLFNALLGFTQEYRAYHALQGLQHLLAPTAKVIRDGQRQDIPAQKLVPGDIVILEIGRIVPADGVLIESDSLSVNEAILTGESMPVEKKVSQAQSPSTYEARGTRGTSDTRDTSLIYMGTTVVTGIGKIIVTTIGNQTRMGQIASTLAETQEPLTPLQKQVSYVARYISIAVGVIAITIFLAGVLTHRSPIEMFELSVAIAVAAIPEGLAITVTVILAIGMQRLLRRRALVRKLVSAETLGSVTTICIDKTGTLTEGNMKVVNSEFTDDQLGKAAVAACNDLRDPLETAMYAWVPHAQELSQAYPREDEIPFSPAHKYIATLHSSKEILFVSGAPEVLLARSNLSDAEMGRWLKKFKTYGSKGLRLVSFAYKTIAKDKKRIEREDIADLEWLGIVIFDDPVRDSVAPALRRAQELGLSIHVITGDYRPTAEAVLRALGVPGIMLHARVQPEEKFAIVKELQSKGEVVAMTGDGVNDAPALKAADIGIVVSGASDVSKEIADMVLLDNNFSTIIAAIVEGRGMLVNVRKIITYLLSDAFSGVFAIAASLLLPIPIPLLATQILWINLISDGLPSLALTVEPFEDGATDVKVPKSARHSSLLNNQMKIIIVSTSLMIGLSTLVGFLWILHVFGDVTLARSVAFALLGTSSLFYVFSIRSLHRPIWRVNHLKNPLLFLSVLIGFGLQLIPLNIPFFQNVFHSTSLLPVQWVGVAGTGLGIVVFVEAMKWLTNRPLRTLVLLKH